MPPPLTPRGLACLRRVPPLGLAPPVVAALHPFTAAPTEVRAADELHTDDLGATLSIELHANVELHVDEPPFSSKQQGCCA